MEDLGPGYRVLAGAIAAASLGAHSDETSTRTHALTRERARVHTMCVKTAMSYPSYPQFRPTRRSNEFVSHLLLFPVPDHDVALRLGCGSNEPFAVPGKAARYEVSPSREEHGSDSFPVRHEVNRHLTVCTQVWFGLSPCLENGWPWALLAVVSMELGR